MKIIAKIISVLFHPSLMITYAFILFLIINPYIFGVDRFLLRTPLLFSVIFLSFLFPGGTVLMMRKLNLISGITLQNPKERIGPYIAAIIFYLWLYINIRSNFEIPELFKSLVLGSTISLCLLFFFNNFNKVSAHMAGMTGLSMFTLFLIYTPHSGMISLSLLSPVFERIPALLPALVIFCTGLVGYARIELGVHTLKQICGGFMIGLFSQMIAYIVYFK
ncbi:MAG TPA: hypothetical protein PK076_10180 [Saprospiraceae bacterium]|nr:hypothetical protein [Saprospiraceae bacterium]HQW56486.1 hypothetical protein [Saprospiraceae bacterium]